jgi:hypothetical protein
MFFKMGCRRIHTREDTVYNTSIKPYAWYEIAPKLNKNVTPKELLPEMSIGNLYTMLRYAKNIMSNELREELMNQSFEISDLVEKRFNSDDIISINVALHPPGVRIPTHIHGENKYTLTFMHTFEYDKIQSDRKDAIIIDDRQEVPFLDSERVFFGFNPKVRHGSYTNKWRFYYIIDFDQMPTIDIDAIQREDNFTYMPIVSDGI